MNTPTRPRSREPRPPRRRRWLLVLGLVLLAAALAAYGFGLRWLSLQLADDVAGSIHSLTPAVEDTRHRAQ